MSNWKIKSIQRWENEGGPLLPRDYNVHFWNYPSIGFRKRDGKQPPRALAAFSGSRPISAKAVEGMMAVDVSPLLHRNDIPFGKGSPAQAPPTAQESSPFGAGDSFEQKA